MSIAISSLVHFLLRIIIGKDLGVDGLGVYTLIFTIYLFGMQFANFGIGAAITKYVAEKNEDISSITRFVSYGIISSVLVGTIISIILFFLSPFISLYIFHDSNVEILLKITALCFPFIAVQKAVLGGLNGLRKMKYYAFLNIILNVLTIIVSIILVIILNMGIIGAVIGFVIPTVISGILSFITIKEYFIIPNQLFNETFIIITSFGFYVMLGNSISMINTQINTLLLGFYLNTFEVGLFAVATTLIQGMLLIPSSIQIISGPSFSRLNSKKEYTSLKLVTKKCIIYTFIVMFIISIIFIIVGNQLIPLLFTEDYKAAYIPLVIMIIGYLIYSPFVSIGSIFANIGQVKLSFKINLISTFITVILNLIMIPTYGIIGAAIATTISLIITTIINLAIIKIYINKWTLKIVTKPN
ncbi:flippase [Methanooceanicella nereidis]|uniref:flippase n=1 Tax=Methanooceanicella nereidis TaxID=2052831 RepID=UPI0034E1E9B7